MYKSLNDAAVHHPELDKGDTKIWYAINTRDWGMGYDFLAKHCADQLPKSVEDIKKTHALMGSIKEKKLEKIYMLMQGHNWSPNGEARELDGVKKSHHTSMSMGDVIQIKDKLYMVDSMGFTDLMSGKEADEAAYEAHSSVEWEKEGSEYHKELNDGSMLVVFKEKDGKNLKWCWDHYSPEGLDLDSSSSYFDDEDEAKRDAEKCHSFVEANKKSDILQKWKKVKDPSGADLWVQKVPGHANLKYFLMNEKGNQNWVAGVSDENDEPVSSDVYKGFELAVKNLDTLLQHALSMENV